MIAIELRIFLPDAAPDAKGLAQAQALTQVIEELALNAYPGAELEVREVRAAK